MTATGGSFRSTERDEPTQRTVTLQLDDFAWEAVDELASIEGSTVEELIRYSLLYYLADLDSGRISRPIPRIFRRRTSLSEHPSQ